jgi:hypothetical protein
VARQFPTIVKTSIVAVSGKSNGNAKSNAVVNFIPVAIVSGKNFVGRVANLVVDLAVRFKWNFAVDLVPNLVPNLNPLTKIKSLSSERTTPSCAPGLEREIPSADEIDR